MDSTLEQALNKIIEEKTFSVEATEAIVKLRADFSVLKDQYNHLEKSYDKLNKSEINLIEDNIKLRNRLQEYDIREADLLAREKKITRLEIEKECADKLVSHTTGLFNTVFANASLKTSIMKNVPVVTDMAGGGSGYNPGQQVVTHHVVENTNQEIR